MVPWLQRGQEAPKADRYTEAVRALGAAATVDELAEYLDVDPRTVRRWRADVRRVS